MTSKLKQADNPKSKPRGKGLSTNPHSVYQRKRNALKRASTVDGNRVIDTAIKRIQDSLAADEVRAVDLPKVLQSLDKLLERRDLRKVDISPSEELTAFLKSIDLPDTV